MEYCRCLSSLQLGAAKDDDDELVVPSLEVGEKTLSFDESATQKLVIEANGHWRVKAIKDSAQFIVTPEEGNGNGEVTITLNRSKQENINGYLQVTYTDGTDEGLQVARGVKLLASKLDMDVFPKNATFNPAVYYNEQSFTVDIPGKWTASLSDEKYFILDRTSGDGKGQIKVFLKEGVTAKNKTAELVVVPEAYPLVKYVIKIDESRAYEYDQYIVVNKASVGKGIDVVILGDFFKAEDLKKDGKWEQAINIFMEYMFAMEPYKSYRDYFNIYAVPHLCEYELPEIDSGDEVETPFATYRGTGLNETNGVSSNRQQMAAAYKYAYEHTPVAADKGTWRDLTVGLVLNTEFRKYGIVAWSNNVNRYEDCGMSLTPIPIFGEGGLTTMFGHEMLGHGFGGFCENYFSGTGTFPPDRTFRAHQEMYQTRLDVEFSNDPDQFVNRAWAELYKMNYRNVQIVEGAQNMAYGIWRAFWISVMGNGDKGSLAGEVFYYNPVQREIILRTIYKLAGLEDEYSLQTFLDYDQNNEENIRTDAKMMEYAKQKYSEVDFDALVK